MTTHLAGKDMTQTFYGCRYLTNNSLSGEVPKWVLEYTKNYW